MEQPEYWFGQEVEPTPIDAVDEAIHALVFLVAADHFPLFRTCEELRCDCRGAARFDGLCGLYRFSQIDVVVDVVFGNGFERALRHDRGHPIVIRESDPSAFGHLHDICRRPLLGVDIKLGHIVIFGFVQLAI